jgi:hypothetical protein
MGRVFSFFAEKQILFWIYWLITGGYGFSVAWTDFIQEYFAKLLLQIS